MKETIANKELIAYCGLYCGCCKKYIEEKCKGCSENEKASWCKIRSCCIENEYSSCAECETIPDIKQCNKLNNFISKLFAIVFKSDRIACLKSIKEKGYDNFAKDMVDRRTMTVKK